MSHRLGFYLFKNHPHLSAWTAGFLKLKKKNFPHWWGLKKSRSYKLADFKSETHFTNYISLVRKEHLISPPKDSNVGFKGRCLNRESAANSITSRSLKMNMNSPHSWREISNALCCLWIPGAIKALGGFKGRSCVRWCCQYMKKKSCWICWNDSLLSNAVVWSSSKYNWVVRFYL